MWGWDHTTQSRSTLVPTAEMCRSDTPACSFSAAISHYACIKFKFDTLRSYSKNVFACIPLEALWFEFLLYQQTNQNKESLSQCQATIWSCSKKILTLVSTWHRATASFLFEWCRLWCQTPVIYFRLENTWPFVCVSQPYRCSLSCLTTHTRTASESAPVRPQVLKEVSQRWSRASWKEEKGKAFPW